MAHRNARDLDAGHNTAIRREIGYRLRAGLMREPTNPPQHIQDLLDRLTDDTKGWTNRDHDTSQKLFLRSSGLLDMSRPAATRHREDT
jgi:hypothetical protein